MALTKEDIEEAIAQTENQDAIRHSLSNYFEDLDEPVAVAIGIGEKQWDRNLHPENVDKLVNLLRSKGIDAVSFLDPQAAHSDKFVVNESGVLCPFMSPQDSLKAATLIGDTVVNAGHQIVGHINPQSRENILYTADSSIKIQNNAALIEQGINLEQSHPDKEVFKEIERRNGGDYRSFIDRKINEAYAGSEVVDFNSMDTENVYQNGMAELYRGGTLGNNPYATVSQWNSRKVAHSSPAISVCAGFSGKEKTLSSRGGAVYEKTQSGIYYGFIYKLESMGDKQQFYHNVGLETGDNARTKEEVNLSVDVPWNGHNGEIYETPILPHHNKLKAMYVYVGHPGESEARLYSIPLDENGRIADPEWQDFMALHEPTDDKVMGYLKDRQDAQKREQTENPQHTYNFELKQGLEADNQEYLNTVSAHDFLRNFIHDGEVQEKDGNLYLDAISDERSFNIEGLKLKELPDFSNVKINGHFTLNSNTIPEVDATRLPECSKGMVCIGVDVKNVSALSADKFLSIIGAEAKKKPFEEYFSLQDGAYNDLSCDGMPQGWNELKFMELPAFVNLVYDSMDEVPETLRGIGLSGVSVKDQSSIENMSATDFIYKVKGNLGTHPLGFDVSVMYSQGIRHTEIHDDIEMNLEHTNIGTFPKDMKELTLKQIILNHETVVTSLDNFPITKKGVLDLNFKGDLKNETMESFLLKTKGTEWVRNNTSKGEDGHLIINGDFDFKTKAWSGSDRAKMEITSLPKDILDVEFKGMIEPFELRYRLNDYLKVLKDKDSNSLLLSNIDLKMDLSQHQVTDISIRGKTQDVVLPPNIKKVFISDSKNFQVSVLKNTLQNINLSFNEVQNEVPIDMTNMPINRLSFRKVQATEISIPQGCEEIYFSETQLNKPITLSPGIKIFEAQLTNFPEGSVLNLQECKSVSLINCSLPKNTTLDLSKCEQVYLSDVDLSQVNIILPQSGRVLINENVKFAPDYKLDLSKNNVGFVHHSVECAEIKLPQKIITDNAKAYKVPKQTKEITTSCIAEAYCNFSIPPHVKIIDTPDKYGKKVKLSTLAHRGVNKTQIKTLRKERILAPVKRLITKIIPAKTEPTTNSAVQKKKAISKIDIMQQDKAKIAALSGRGGTKSQYSMQTEEKKNTVVVEQTAVQARTEEGNAVCTPTVQKSNQQQTNPVNSDVKSADSLWETQEKVSDMNKKEKKSFFEKLRNGVNTILAKAEAKLSPAKTVSQTQEKVQTNAPKQSSIIEQKVKKDRGMSM